jgi:hypothetical protein
VDYENGYRVGHRVARHACAEIALEADSRIAALEAANAELEEAKELAEYRERTANTCHASQKAFMQEQIDTRDNRLSAAEQERDEWMQKIPEHGKLVAKLAEQQAEIERLEELREMEGAAIVNGAAMLATAQRRADTAEAKLATAVNTIADLERALKAACSLRNIGFNECHCDHCQDLIDETGTSKAEYVSAAERIEAMATAAIDAARSRGNG